MCRIHIDLHIQYRRHAADTLCADTQCIDFVIQFDSQSFQRVLRTTLFQFGHVQRFHRRFFCHQHSLFRRTADADADNTRRTPAGPHVPDSLDNMIDDRVRRIEHFQGRLVFRTTTLGADRDLDRIARHDIHHDDGRRIVPGVLACKLRVVHDRRAQLVVRERIGTPDPFVDRVMDTAGESFPPHIHTYLQKNIDDTRILTDRPLALCAHA